MDTAFLHKMERKLIAWDESIMEFVGAHETPKLLTEEDTKVLLTMLIMRCQLRRKCIALGSKLNPIDPVERFLRDRGIAA